MPSTERYKGEVQSLSGDNYDIIIDDDQHFSTTGPIELVGGNGFSLKYLGKNNDPFEPVVASKVTFVMFIEHAAHTTFINDLVAAGEGRFKLKITKNDNLWWVGHILTDGVVEQDEPYPYELKLTAIDGLGKLKEIDYNNNGVSYTGREVLIDHVFNCLDKTGLNYFFNAGDRFLEVAINYYGNTHTVADTTDPLKYTDLHHWSFYDIDKKGNYKYQSCFKVLQNICCIRS